MELVRIPGGVDFDVPVEFKFLNGVGAGGALGASWRFPQLESALIPRGRGVFEWRMPNGGGMALLPSKQDEGAVYSEDGQWRARWTGRTATVENQERWRYTYVDGRLERVTAPSGRFLAVVWQGKRCVGMELHDEVAGKVFPLASYRYFSDGKLSEVEIGGKIWQLDFETGKDGRFVQLRQPDGGTVDFAYSEIGVLTNMVVASRNDHQSSQLAVGSRQESSGSSQLAVGSRQQEGGSKAEMGMAEGSSQSAVGSRQQNEGSAKVESGKQKAERTRRVVNFKTKYVSPYPLKGKDTKEDYNNPANYWLIEDDLFLYTYRKNTSTDKDANPDYWQADAVELTDKASKQVVKSETSMRRGVVSAAGDEGNVVRYYYRAPGQVYDGKLRRVEKDGQLVADYKYERETGRLLEQTGPDGISTFFEYEPVPKSKPIKSLFDEPRLAQPVRVYRGTTRQKELVETRTYDDNGKLRESKDAEGNKVKVVYDLYGQVLAVEKDGVDAQRFKYDELGRVIEVAQGDRKQTRELDAQGRVVKETLPDGRTRSVDYNEKGQAGAVRVDGKVQATMEYDAQGRVVAKWDALGRVTRYELDAAGRMTAETQPNGTVTRYEYDAQGRRTAQVDANGNRVEFKFDKAGRMIEQKNPTGQLLTWTYNKAGRLIGKGNSLTKTTYDYDSRGRVTRLDYGAPGEQLGFRYDPLGRLKLVQTPTLKERYHYLAGSRIRARQIQRGDQEQVLRFGYTPSGAKAQVVLSEKVVSDKPDAPAYRLLQQTDYEYTGFGMLKALRCNGVPVFTCEYDGKGRPVRRIFGNGMVAEYQHNAAGMLTRMELKGGLVMSPLVLTYDWDVAGQVTSRSWAGTWQTFDYDPSGQLLAVHEAPLAKTNEMQVVERYTYDPAGNMLTKAVRGVETVMTYSTANQIRTSTTDGVVTTYDYDRAGRLNTVSQAGDAPQTVSYAYGWLDKVLAVTRPDGKRIGFDYYPDGQVAVKGPLPAPGEAVASGAAGERKPGAVAGLMETVKQAFAKTPVEPELVLAATPDQSALQQRETMVWDGLALIRRNNETYAIEPHVSGGVPVAVSRVDQPGVDRFLINDILGNTLAVVSAQGVQVMPLTTFGRVPKQADAAAAVPQEIKAEAK